MFQLQQLNTELMRWKIITNWRRQPSCVSSYFPSISLAKL